MMDGVMHLVTTRVKQVHCGVAGGLTKGSDTPPKTPFSWVVVSAKLMGDSPENSLTIFIRGGEPWLMGYCWRTH
jgi:hypothetical protein